jgi:hypothetical protein
MERDVPVITVKDGGWLSVGSFQNGMFSGVRMVH